MNKAISVVMFVLAIVMSFSFAFFIRYFTGFRSSNLIEVTGYLSIIKLHKNVFRGHPFCGKWYKCWTSFEYSYRVGDKQLSLNGGRPGFKKDLPYTVKIVAQKNAPSNAFIPEFDKIPSKWILCFLFFGCAILYTVGYALWIL